MTTITENDHNAQNSPGADPSRLARIKSLVQRFAVCWEAHPEQAVVTVPDLKGQAPRVKRELRKIGFSLELYGTPEPGLDNASPGGDPCRRVESALKEIAHWILPRQQRQCMYEVEIDQSLSHSRVRADRPDVCVTIQIVHRNNWDQPIDECEESCLKDMERALDELGACDGAWRPLPTAG
jgi:hypothetical protein